jgi:hypothetical protein
MLFKASKRKAVFYIDLSASTYIDEHDRSHDMDCDEEDTKRVQIVERRSGRIEVCIDAKKKKHIFMNAEEALEGIYELAV